MNKPHRSEDEQEFERARELLERTVQFLSHCMEDPEGALRAQDPRVLIQGLKALTVEPAAEPAPEADEAPRTIQIRRRRSA